MKEIAIELRRHANSHFHNKYFLTRRIKGHYHGIQWKNDDNNEDIL